MKHDIPLAAFERIIKSADAEIRISDSAKAELRQETEHIASSVAAKAARLSEHAGRRTVKPEDVRLAFEQK